MVTATFEHIVRGKGESQLFTNITASAVNNREPISVGVLSEASIGLVPHNSPAKIRQILLHRFRNMFEPTVWHSTQHDDFAAELFEQSWSADGARTVVAVKDNSVTPLPNGFNIDEGEHLINVDA